MKYKLLFRICAAFLAFSGITILCTTVFPILSYEYESASRYPILVSSLIEEESGNINLTGRDLTKASNWFEGSGSSNSPITQEVSYFTLTVPKLRITNASVAIGGDDLSEHLIQYPGTALPGKTGNSVIFGHSILPQFFDPKNYMAIFSTLHTLKKGDEIIASYDGVTYRYKVENMFEVKPTDIQILDQSRSDSYLTLVTCSPPGNPFKPRRLIVRAKIAPQTTASAL
jgi:sortase A